MRIVKRNHLGQVLDVNIKTSLAWNGFVRSSLPSACIVQCQYDFRGKDKHLGYVTIKHGDLSIEHFFPEKMYNIFSLFDWVAPFFQIIGRPSAERLVLQFLQASHNHWLGTQL